MAGVRVSPPKIARIAKSSRSNSGVRSSTDLPCAVSAVRAWSGVDKRFSPLRTTMIGFARPSGPESTTAGLKVPLPSVQLSAVVATSSVCCTRSWFTSRSARTLSSTSASVRVTPSCLARAMAWLTLASGTPFAASRPEMVSALTFEVA